MFRNFKRAISRSSISSTPFQFNKSKDGIKSVRKFDNVFNTRVRTFNTSSGGATATNSTSQAMLGVGSGLLLLGGGYFLMKSLNSPNVAVNSQSPSAVAQEEFLNRNADLAKTGIPSHVKHYLQQTFKYVFYNIGLTALAGVAFYKSGMAMRMTAMNPLAYMLLMGGGLIGTSIATRAIDMHQSPGLKYASWIGFNTVLGLSLCSLGLLYRPELIFRAALYSGGIFGALSFTAMNAETNRFLNMGGPLMAGLTVVFLSSIMSLVLPARFVKTLSVMEKIWLWGGLAVFGGLVLYDTQVIMQKGENYAQYKQMQDNRGVPEQAQRQPDYISNSIDPYLTFINIFVRMLYIMGGGTRRK